MEHRRFEGLLQHSGLFGLGKHFGGVLGVELFQEEAPVPLDGGKGELLFQRTDFFDVQSGYF